jgi:hypothetical protein
MIYPKLQNLHEFAYYICQLSDAKLWQQKNLASMPCHDNPWSVKTKNIYKKITFISPLFSYHHHYHHHYHYHRHYHYHYQESIYHQQFSSIFN